MNDEVTLIGNIGEANAHAASRAVDGPCCTADISHGYKYAVLDCAAALPGWGGAGGDGCKLASCDLRQTESGVRIPGLQ